MKNLIRRLLILVFPLFVLACTPSSGIQLKDTQAELQEEVDRFVKVGMPVPKAKQIMKTGGFECKDRKNSSFSLDKRDENGHTIGQTIFVKGDFLSCSVIHYYIIGSTGWWVFLLYKDNTVSLVHAVVNHQSL